MRHLIRRLFWQYSGLTGRVRSAASRIVLQAVHLTVRSGDGGFALFGGVRHRHHLRRVYLDGARGRVRVGWHRGDAAGTARRIAADLGLVAFTADALPAELADEVLRVPLMRDLRRPLPGDGTLDGIRWSSSARADLSRIRRAGYTYTIDRDPRWIPTYLREFSDPSMTARHADEAFHATDAYLRRLFAHEHAEFLRLSLGGKCVAAIVNSQDDQGYRLRSLGWLRGAPDLLKQGVVGALYFYSLERAAALGYASCAFGGVWPYLEDRLLAYKAKWGGTFDRVSRLYPDSYLLLAPSHPRCREFLNAHSLILRGADDAFIVLSAHRPETMVIPATLMPDIARWYRWRADGEAAPPLASPEIPARLRPWLVEERVPR